jgi:hypothetical protein
MVNVHRLAKTYHKLPTEILELSLEEYELNAAIREAGLKADDREAKANGQRNTNRNQRH